MNTSEVLLQLSITKHYRAREIAHIVCVAAKANHNSGIDAYEMNDGSIICFKRFGAFLGSNLSGEAQ